MAGIPNSIRSGRYVQTIATELRDLLTRSLRFPSISGHEGPFTLFIADWASKAGFDVDLWYSNETELAQYPLAHAKHIPLEGRPTAVITHRGAPSGTANGRSLMFNAHTDVVAAPEPGRWRVEPFAGQESEGRIYGRGACDVKGPLVASLGAMLALKHTYPNGLPASVSLELVPGEEDCVGLGTLTSLHRGHRADGLVVLEPTENQPRCASRGGCRFEITCRGTAVHGTVKWLGQDAIQAMRSVLAALEKLESDWNDRQADPLFVAYPLARPITVDSLHGGQWQGMVCDHCTCAGYLELLPNDDLSEMQVRFRRDLLAILAGSGKDLAGVNVAFSEVYGGHRTDPGHPLCVLAETTAKSSGHGGPESERWAGWSGFNSGCEAGLRASIQQTPTLVWGPGSLAQAHAVDEFIEWAAVERSARLFADFAQRWCGSNEPN
jgi:acetylornithine deacetylase